MNHIVALSGGKDSTAMALRLQEVEPRDYLYICTPTGDELPEMEEHWQRIETKIGAPLLRLKHPVYPTIYDLIEHFQALPNYHQRWCTRILKIEVAQMFYEEHIPAIIYVGLRADEMTRKGNSLYDENIKQCFPMQSWGWGINEVQQYLENRNIEIPRRTDCALCFYQRIGEWFLLWKEYPEIFDKISLLEDRIGHTLMTPGKHKIWPCKLSELRKEFESGRTPKISLKRMERESCRVCSL